MFFCRSSTSVTIESMHRLLAITFILHVAGLGNAFQGSGFRKVVGFFKQHPSQQSLKSQPTFDQRSKSTGKYLSLFLSPFV